VKESVKKKTVNEERGHMGGGKSETAKPHEAHYQNLQFEGRQGKTGGDTERTKD